MRVLIVEDHFEISETYRLILEAENHEVLVVSDGAKALSTYFERPAEGRPPFDIVVLDFRIPQIDGIEVAKRILAKVANQRILIASSYPADAIARNVENSHIGMVELLTKPFDLADFVDIISKTKAVQMIGMETAASPMCSDSESRILDPLN